MNKALSSGMVNLLQRQSKHNNLGSVGGAAAFQNKVCSPAPPIQAIIFSQVNGLSKILVAIQLL